MVSASELDAGRWASVSLPEHIEAFGAFMAGRGRTAKHVRDTLHLIRRVAEGCAWRMLRDMSRSSAENWIREQDVSARRRNAYSIAGAGFGGWLVKSGRATVNPFAGIHKENVKLDRRHVRRALTHKEADRLLHAAAERPLYEALHGNRGEAPAKLGDKARAALVWRGRVRAMAYRVMLATGLRYGELRALRLGDVRLESAPAYIELPAKYEKARRGARLPLDGRTARELGYFTCPSAWRCLHAAVAWCKSTA